MHCKNTLTVALLVPLLFAAACTDTARTTAPAIRVPAAANTSQPSSIATLTCAASIRQRTVTCTPPDTGTSGATRDVIIGGQNQYVTLTSSNVQVAGSVFSFDVSVTNLIPHPIGTSDGTTPDAAGVQVFFNSGPTSTTGGTIAVANPDGTAAFTASAQPYFQYNTVLAQNAVSTTKNWQLQFTPDVTNFVFTVYVAAAVQYPNGYVDDVPYVLALNPGESRALSGTVRSYVGTPTADQTIAWTTNAPATAAISGTQVTAGSSRGTTTITAAAGTKPAVNATAVSVCQSTVVADGTNLPSSISSSDCFSTFGSPDGLPTTSYYADLYRVTLTAGQTVTITMDSGDDLDTYLILADGSTGRIVGINDDDDTGVLGVGSRLVYTATTSGTYVIEGSTFNGLDTGSYTLHVTIN